MRYRIKLMSKDEVYITEEEYQKIISSKATGLIFIESLKGTINLNSVETILPEDQVPEKEITEGYLHDGTRVVKQFGIWKDAVNPNVELDSLYYPEIAMDRVLKKEELEEVKKLDRIGLNRYLLGIGEKENKIISPVKKDISERRML